MPTDHRIVQDHAGLFRRLSQSSFRSKFKLTQADTAYLEAKGLETIKNHAADFINSRIAPAGPRNDGQQTPMRGHPVFKAQHATATCCRGCIAKWHGITKGRELSAEEQRYLVTIIIAWIEMQTHNRSSEHDMRSGILPGTISSLP
jgi:exodeoxyribonuclease V alpha subunit